MKKIMIAMVAALMATMNVNAQSEELKNEIGISYGTGISQIGDGIGNGVGNGLFDTMTGHKWTNESRVGTFAVEYFRHLNNPRLAVGAVTTFASFGEDVVNSDDIKVGDRKRTYISLMPAVKYYWVNKTHFGFYSKAAAGAMMMFYKDNTTDGGKSSTTSKLYFMGQASPVGLEAGSKNIRAFLELGIGEQGIALLGLRAKF